MCRAKVTNLVGKHISSDLDGNNVGVICEDVVQNGAVILSCNNNENIKGNKQLAEGRLTLNMIIYHQDQLQQLEHFF